MASAMELLSELELAVAAAREAGALVLRSFGRDQVVTHKTPDQPLTEADLEADAALRTRLLEARPGYGWLSEETADRPDRLTRRRVWIVDPIDGTRSFVAGRPEFAISVALAEDGEAVVGVVYNPASGELYRAVRGGGSYLEEDGGEPRPLAIAAAEAGRRPVLLASRSEIAAGELDPFRGGWAVLPTGSTAYKLARVAAGHGDAFVSRGPKSEWDVAAGALLVEEAGGRATDLRGRRLRFNGADPFVEGIVAGSAPWHERVLREAAPLPPSPRMLRRRADPLHPGLEEGGIE